MYAQFLKVSSQVPPTVAKVEELVSDDKRSLEKKHVPKIELKPLPSSLRNEFLGTNSTYPVIVNANISAPQIDSLLRELRLHRKAMGYTVDDLKELTLLCASIVFNWKMTINHQLNIKEGRNLT